MLITYRIYEVIKSLKSKLAVHNRYKNYRMPDLSSSQTDFVGWEHAKEPSFKSGNV
jgi:hypothetical protein